MVIHTGHRSLRAVHLQLQGSKQGRLTAEEPSVAALQPAAEQAAGAGELLAAAELLAAQGVQQERRLWPAELPQVWAAAAVAQPVQEL